MARSPRTKGDPTAPQQDDLRQSATEFLGAASLTGPQELALEQLLSGQSITAAAQIAGVSRASLHRWLRSDFQFCAALNAARAAARSAALARLDALADRAIGVVAQALDEGDRKVAIAVLRGLGLLSGEQEPGSSDAAELQAEEAAAKDRRSAAANRAASEAAQERYAAFLNRARRI